MTPPNWGGLQARRLASLGRLSEEELLQAETLVQTLAGSNEAGRTFGAACLGSTVAALRPCRGVDAGPLAPAARGGHLPALQERLADKTDTVSGKPIADHLRQFIGTESEILEKTAAAWEQDALAHLRDAFGQTLQAELSQDLPATPADLITAAFAEDLFQPQCLKGCLAILKTATRTLCAKAVAALPAFKEPTCRSLPDHSAAPERHLPLRAPSGALSLSLVGGVAMRLLATPLSRAIIGQSAAAAQESVATADEQTLLQRLLTLDKLVKTAEPINHALTKVKALTDLNGERVKKQEAIKRYERAATAIDELLELPALVEMQVGFLMKTLAEATAQWKEKLYSPAFIRAPSAVNPSIGPDGAIAIDAAAEGARPRRSMWAIRQSCVRPYSRFSSPSGNIFSTLGAASAFWCSMTPKSYSTLRTCAASPTPSLPWPRREPGSLRLPSTLTSGDR